MSEEKSEQVIDIQAGGDATAPLVPTSGNVFDMSALNSHIKNMLMMQSLPPEVKRRVKSLKKLQFDMLNIESDFYREVHELECKYAAKYDPLFTKRSEIVTGALEPTDSDCEWPSDVEDEEVVAALKEKVAIQNEITNSEEEKVAPAVGIPKFWLTVFKNVELLSDMVQEHDEPIIEHLRDIQVRFLESDPIGFRLEFYFDENEYFTNKLLTKEYHMRAEPDKEEPFSYEGPEIVNCIGCEIDWNKGKNVTVRVVKKTQKHKNRGVKRTITKTVANDSFFNFFKPPVNHKGEGGDDESDDDDDDYEGLLAADFEIGHYIRERIVPRAILYFTGEAMDDEDDDDDDDEYNEDDDDEDDEDESDDDEPGEKPQGGEQQKPDCKQQ